MSRRTHRAFGPILAVTIGFLAGALFTGILLTTGPIESAASGRRVGDDCGEAALTGNPDPPNRPVAAVPVSRPAPESTLRRIGTDPIADLRDRQLAIPVRGVERGDLRSSFWEKRGSNRVHEAIDILAARHTPVIAVEDGTIARLFASQAGGTTIYQYDPSSTYVYYYAHLQRYAPGLEEGAHVKRGDVIGYVGTSGNAPEDTPHLHFAIFKMTDKKQWWQGTAIDPYGILAGEGK
ncbi:MAG TPA: M23 family metallopeptidase [Vicinamibacterales bacterium]|jgi:murein DD-endopeptidase MepM/ murein hydrolase activator NlpD